jgi:hypothetical protein
MMKSAVILIVLAMASPLISKGQEEEPVRIQSGLNARYTLSYNYRVLHNMATLGFNFGNNQLYAGAGHVAILGPFGNPLRNYRNYSSAGVAGYRNYFYTAPANIHLFGQFQFAFYPVNYNVPNLPNFDPDIYSTDFILENTLSIGGEYLLRDRLSLSFGTGIGSTDGFFLVRSSLFLLGFVGVQYHIR